MRFRRKIEIVNSSGSIGRRRLCLVQDTIFYDFVLIKIPRFHFKEIKKKEKEKEWKEKKESAEEIKIAKDHPVWNIASFAVDASDKSVGKNAVNYSVELIKSFKRSLEGKAMQWIF